MFSAGDDSGMIEEIAKQEHEETDLF